MTADWTPLEVTDHLLRRWWLVAALVALGGLLGLGLAQLRPAIYEATVPMAASIDYARSGPLEEIEQEYALDQLMAVVDHPGRPEQIALRVRASGLDLTEEQVADAIRLDRQGFTLLMTARHSDGDDAGQIALAWAGLAHEDVSSAFEHALQAQIIRDQLETPLECTGETCAQEAQARLLLAEAAADEEVLARGLSPILGVDLEAVAEADIRRIDGQGGWVIAGMGLGLILAIWLVESSRAK